MSVGKLDLVFPPIYKRVLYLGPDAHEWFRDFLPPQRNRVIVDSEFHVQADAIRHNLQKVIEFEYALHPEGVSARDYDHPPTRDLTVITDALYARHKAYSAVVIDYQYYAGYAGSVRYALLPIGLRRRAIIVDKYAGLYQEPEVLPFFCERRDQGHGLLFTLLSE